MIIPLWAKALGALGLLAAAIIAFKLYIASERADERKEVVAEVTVAEQAQTITDLKKTLKTEREQNTITEQSNAKQASDLASANSRLAAYLGRLRAPSGGVGQGAGVSGLPGATNVADGPDRLSLLDDDLRKCTAIAVRLGNAKEWGELQTKVVR